MYFIPPPAWVYALKILDFGGVIHSPCNVCFLCWLCCGRNWTRDRGYWNERWSSACVLAPSASLTSRGRSWGRLWWSFLARCCSCQFLPVNRKSEAFSSQVLWSLTCDQSMLPRYWPRLDFLLSLVPFIVIDFLVCWCGTLSLGCTITVPWSERPNGGKLSGVEKWSPMLVNNKSRVACPFVGHFMRCFNSIWFCRWLVFKRLKSPTIMNPQLGNVASAVVIRLSKFWSSDSAGLFRPGW